MASSWPKTVDGTTDWEAVFEASETGLVAMISQANSPESLSRSATVVIENLFTRKSDKPEVAHYMALLHGAIDEGRESGDFEVTRTKVVHVLRRIKRDRIMKALRYVEQKRTSQAIERRSKEDNAALRRKLLAVTGIAAAAVLVLGTAGYFWFGDPSKPVDVAASDDAKAGETASSEAEADADKPAEEKPKPEAAPEPKKKAPAKAEEPKQKAKPLPVYPQAVLLKPFYLGYKPKQGARRYISYQPFIEVPNRESYSTICVNVPWVTDAIFLDLNRLHPKDRKATSAELGDISSRAAGKINKRYGAATVNGIELIPNSDKRFQGAVIRCELERSKGG